jgi:hypothetical protein
MLVPPFAIVNNVLQHEGKEGVNLTDQVVEGIGNLHDWLFGDEEPAQGLTGVSGPTMPEKSENIGTTSITQPKGNAAGTHRDTRTSDVGTGKPDAVWQKYVGGRGGQPVVKIAALGTDGPNGGVVEVVVYADGSAVFLEAPDSKKGGSSTLLRDVPKGTVPLDRLDQLEKTYGAL